MDSIHQRHLCLSPALPPAAAGHACARGTGRAEPGETYGRTVAADIPIQVPDPVPEAAYACNSPAAVRDVQAVMHAVWADHYRIILLC